MFPGSLAAKCTEGNKWHCFSCVCVCEFVSVYILSYSQRPNGVQTSVLVLDHLRVSLQEIEALLRLKTFEIEYELQRDFREI